MRQDCSLQSFFESENCTYQGANISHLGKRKIIDSKVPLGWDILLVGGFNPFEKLCSSNWIISPRFGVKIKKHLKPPPSLVPRRVTCHTCFQLCSVPRTRSFSAAKRGSPDATCDSWVPSWNHGVSIGWFKEKTAICRLL